MEFKRYLFMNRTLFPALFCALLLPSSSVLRADTNPDAAPRILTQWYDKPAAYGSRPTEDGGFYKTLIDQATLIGNGRMGAMIQGEVSKEILALSEDTMWTGGLNPDSDYSKNAGRFQALGNLEIALDGQEEASGYRRSLDLTNALATVSYTANGVRFEREYFASHPDQVLVFRFTASRRGSYSGTLGFTDAHQRITEVNGNLVTTFGGFENGLRYESQILVLNQGGSQKATGDRFDRKIQFDKCNELTILVAIGTNYVPNFSTRYISRDLPHERVSQQLKAAAAQPYEKLKASHIADYQSLFNRYSIDLGASSEAQRSLTTDVRCRQAFKKVDPEFEQFLCQYGRYLIIATSRKGGIAANGQGIWNDCNFCQFGARYTTDLAPTEMTYWSVEPTNLAECHLPLLDLVTSQIPAWKEAERTVPDLKTPSGEFTTRGWEAPGDHNIMGGPSHRWNKGGSAWYLHHFWEHYTFANDTDYLKKTVYPMLKEVCEYWEDHLKALPDGRLIVINYWSPEHGPLVVDGPSYSQELVWDVFTNYIDACDILRVDKEYRAKVADMREKLLKPGIGSWGQLLEWMKEMKDAPPSDERERKEIATEGHIDTPQNTHRHSSHLLGVFPLRQISYEQTPALAAAAKVSTIARGNTGGAYEISYLNRSPIFARLYDAGRAYDQLRQFYRRATPNIMSGTFFDATPAFPGAVAEMLLQSHQGDLHILPALPKEWPAGSVKGLRARGGYEVDELWKEGKLTSLTIRSIAGHAVPVRYGEKTVKLELQPGQSVTLDGNLQVTDGVAILR